MSGPYGITQFDAGAAINAYTAGQQNRIEMMKAKRQAEKDEADAQRQSGIATAIARYTQGSPEAAGAGGVSPGPSTSAAPVAAPAAGAPSAQRQPNAASREQLFSTLMALDHKVAGEVMDVFGKMDKAQADETEKRNTILGKAAQHLMQMPVDQRAAELQRISPLLLEHGGVTEEQLHGFDPADDNQLKFIVGQAMDIDKLLASTRADRKLEWDIADDEIDNEALRVHRAATVSTARRGQDIASKDRRRGQDVGSTDRRRGQDIASTDRRDKPAKAGRAPGSGRAPAGGSGPVAVGPNGQKIVVRGGKWVDAVTGKPVG